MILVANLMNLFFRFCENFIDLIQGLILDYFFQKENEKIKSSDCFSVFVCVCVCVFVCQCNLKCVCVLSGLVLDSEDKGAVKDSANSHQR